jgi:hypothetical protein
MFVNHKWSDIMAFRFFLEGPPYSHLPRYFSAKELCAMPPGIYPTPPDVRAEYEWTPESWTVHFSALSIPVRIALAKKWIQDYNLL